MDYHYPERISDDDVDDDISSCHSSEIEGGDIFDKLTGFELRSHSHGVREGAIRRESGHDDALFDSSTAVYAGATKYGDNDDFTRFGRDDDLDASLSSLNCFNADSSITQVEQNTNEVAVMIQQERNRRLGVRQNVEPANHDEIISSFAPFPERVFGNFRGWFGSGGGSATTVNANGEQSSSSHPTTSLSTHSTRKHKQDNLLHDKPQEMKNISQGNSSLSNPTEESSSDDDSSSASSSISHDDVDFTPQERARERALRYLSNSCVDSGRKSKTASYVWGLEKLDLTRKRDRLAKELEIVESEMNKDHRLTNHAGEENPIPHMGEMLVRELPRIQGPDAGAGIELDNSYFMTWEEYLNAMNSESNPYPSVWDNKGAVDLYVTYLQQRLREAVDRTRSLERRLVVLENAGDDIVSSLCEDLAEITEHSCTTEARYIKKVKELQRKRRREELRHRVKIKEAEHRVHTLEAQLMAANGNTQINEHILNRTDIYEGSDTSTDDSTSNGIDDDDNEVLLEKNLSLLQLKYEQEKQIHKSELESIRRQCEQLKLHLSVARLVMEGDDNLYEYIVLLERCDTSLRRGCKDGVEDIFNNRGQSEVGDCIPPPPSRITRVRAKLLKVIHLERIYERRLVVSKAFTDATIKALDQELVERETLSQELEVRCLNELVVLDAEIKDAQKEAIEKWSVLEKETHELQDAVSVCITQNPTLDLSLFLGGSDPLLKKAELPGNKQSSGRDSPFALRQSSDNGLSGGIGSTNEPEMVQSKTGGTAFVFDEPSVPLHERDHGAEQDKHVIASSDSFNKSNASTPIVVGSQLKKTGGFFFASHSSLAQIDEGNSGAERKVVSIENRERAHEQNGFPSSNQFIDTNNELTETKINQNSLLVETPGKISVDASHPPKMVSNFDEAAFPKAALKELGFELKCTLANYQKSYLSSTSRDKIEHLDTMNDLVVQIAKLFGPTVGLENPMGVSELTSWSFKKARKTQLEKEGRDQTRLKKKTRRRNRDETEKDCKQ